MQLECTYKIYENLNTKVSFKMTWQHLVLEPPINAKTKVVSSVIFPGKIFLHSNYIERTLENIFICN